MNFQANTEILRRLLPPQDDSLRVFPQPLKPGAISEMATTQVVGGRMAAGTLFGMPGDADGIKREKVPGTCEKIEFPSVIHNVS